MAFNKAKTVESAIKYLNQGKISEAIRDYQQVLRYDPKDQVTLMTVGDLFARQGDMPHAIEYFERLAQVYLSEGFNSKAIAIYKKIGKLAPNELQPLERLADLYVQQGVLSEARPLFLQIAEAHLKANHSQKAVEVLRRLVEIEPENLRVQMRLAELYNTMGQKKEAAQNYLNSARRLSERGEAADAQKLIDKALEADPQNKSAALLKAQVLAVGHPEQAVELLRRLPESQEGGETTDLLVDCLVKSGKADEAGQLVRTLFSAHHDAHQLPMRLARMMLDAGQADQAYKLLVDCRDGLIEAGEQDGFREALTLAIERLPNRIEPLETLVDFYRRTSDSFRLPEGILQLAQAQQAAGNYAEAEKLVSGLVEKNPDNEKFLSRLNELRAHQGLPAQAAESLPAMTDIVDTPSVGAEPAPPPPAEAALSEETEKYISQALTDVDLFSSYGLTQKAMNLLDTILERAPRHVPTLERLLDLCLASGNDRRTAQLAAQLEQIHTERGDTTEAERLAELRGRFERAADLKGASAVSPVVAATPAAAAAAPPPVTATPSSAPAAVSEPATSFNMPEFSVPVTIPEPSEEAAEEIGVPAQARAESPIPVVDRELDLSDEWEALAQEFGDTQETVVAPPTPAETVPAEAEPAEIPVPEMSVPTASAEDSASEELFLDVPELSFESDTAAASSEAAAPGETSAPPEFSIPLEADAAKIQEETPEPTEAQASVASRESVLSEVEIPHESPGTSFTLMDEDEPDHQQAEAPVAELSTAPLDELAAESANGTESQLAEPEAPEEAAVPVAAGPIHATESAHAADEQTEPDLEFELVPSDIESTNAASTMMPSDFFSELAAEVEALDLGPAVPPLATASTQPVQPAAAAQVNGAKPRETAPAPSSAPQPPAVLAAAPSNGSRSGLDEVFEEFRSELGEMNDQDEDLETHYNLGIAYREMGLLDEAIGEFQKVAKAVQSGKAFRYAMQCSTLLGVTFLDKGDPKIAAIWYLRALDVPGIDQETILALRYDLGVAQDLAGDSSAALESFRQVYAMNIDYRDVADRIATLRKR